MDIQIITQKINKDKVKQAALESFGEMVKAVVDLEAGIIALGGELHSDAEAMLLQNGSKQENLWGFNIYPDLSNDERLECTSLINIRPARNNPTMEIEDKNIQNKIKEIVDRLIE